MDAITLQYTAKKLTFHSGFSHRWDDTNLMEQYKKGWIFVVGLSNDTYSRTLLSVTAAEIADIGGQVGQARQEGESADYFLLARYR